MLMCYVPNIVDSMDVYMYSLCSLARNGAENFATIYTIRYNFCIQEWKCCWNFCSFFFFSFLKFYFWRWTRGFIDRLLEASIPKYSAVKEGRRPHRRRPRRRSSSAVHGGVDAGHRRLRRWRERVHGGLLLLLPSWWLPPTSPAARWGGSPATLPGGPSAAAAARRPRRWRTWLISLVRLFPLESERNFSLSFFYGSTSNLVRNLIA